MALTATADHLTRQDMIERLKLEEAREFVSSFDRPNIRYTIVEKTDATRQLLRFIQTEHEGEAGIVYCQSRKRVEEIAGKCWRAPASRPWPTTPGWTPACASSARTDSCAKTAW